MLNPIWLETFRTLIDIGHFTQTAEKLSMTQPGVSQHIRKLEDSCGHPLLKRDTKQFVLTEQGRKMYEFACKRQREEQVFIDALKVDDPYCGYSNLACSGALATRLYPTLLALQKSYPKLITQVEAAPNHRILEGIQAGSIDIGIVTRVPEPHLFDAVPFGKEHLSLVLPASYRHTPITTEKLLNLGLIKHPDVYHFLGLFLSACGDSHLKELKPDNLKISGYVNQLGQILLPVAQGLGFTVLPYSAVQGLDETGEVYVPTMPKAVFEPLYWVSQRQRNLPARFATLFNHLHDVG